MTGPGYLHPSWSPDGRYIAATRTSRVRHGRRDPRRDAPAPSSCASPTTARAGRRPGRRAGDQIAYLHVAGQVIDLRMVQLEGSGPTWTVKDAIDLTTAAGLDGVSRPGLVRPGRPSSRARRRPRPPPRPTSPSRRRDLVPRPARRPAARRPARSCASASTPTRRRCPTGSRATLAGVERFARADRRGGAARTPRPIKPNLAFFEAYGSAGIAALERLRALVPADVPFIADAKRGDIGSTAARQAAALFDALGADAVTVNPYLGEEAIAPLLERAGPVRLRAVPDVQPGRRRAAGARRSRRTRRPAPRPSRSGRASRGAPTSWGPGGTVGLVVGATAPAELAAIRALAPGLAFLVPGVGAQGGEVDPVLAAVPRRPRPAGGRPGGGLLVNVSRGIARAAVDEPADAGRVRRPRRAPRGGRRRVGRTPRCATLTPFRDGLGPPRSRTRSIHRDAVQHRTR